MPKPGLFHLRLLVLGKFLINLLHISFLVCKLIIEETYLILTYHLKEPHKKAQQKLGFSNFINLQDFV